MKRKDIVMGDPVGNRIREATKFLKYKVRMCQTSHRCALCFGDIRWGQTYYDGGYSRRAHVDCVEKWMEETK